jgi:glycogen(starch) synthase
MDLLPALEKRGHQFLVVTSHSRRDLPDVSRVNNIEVARFHFQKPLVKRDMKGIADLKKQLLSSKQRFKPDLIHLNTIQPSIFFHELTQKDCPAPVLVTLHEPVSLYPESNTLQARILKSADWVAAVSEAMLSLARNLIPDIKNRSSVIYNALEPPDLEPSNLCFDPPKLACMGRLIEDKGFDLAIDAYKVIVEEFPGARLVIAGDGPCRNDLKKMARGLNTAHPVEFTGWIPVEKMPEFLDKATVVIVPSRWDEPFGLVALQAAQMARPVVAARVGGLAEVVIPEKTGLLFEKNNSRELATAVCSLLRNPQKTVQMGREARERTSKLFRLDRMVNEYDTLYRRIGTKGQGPVK